MSEFIRCAECGNVTRCVKQNQDWLCCYCAFPSTVMAEIATKDNLIAILEAQLAEVRELLKDIHDDITMLDEGIPMQADVWDRLCLACEEPTEGNKKEK